MNNKHKKSGEKLQTDHTMGLCLITVGMRLWNFFVTKLLFFQSKVVLQVVDALNSP